MAAKKKKARTSKRPPPGVPWERFAKPALVLVAIGLGAVWVYHMQGIAVRKQLARDLSEHPATATWFQEQKTTIDISSSRGESCALWVGQVVRTVNSGTPTGESGLKLIELRDVQLLSGTTGSRDGGGVHISVFGYRFPTAEPAGGERWAFSVRRNADAHNFVLSAVRCGG